MKKEKSKGLGEWLAEVSVAQVGDGLLVQVGAVGVEYVALTN